MRGGYTHTSFDFWRKQTKIKINSIYGVSATNRVKDIHLILTLLSV